MHFHDHHERMEGQKARLDPRPLSVQVSFSEPFARGDLHVCLTDDMST